MPVESPFPLLFPKSWVCVCVWEVGNPGGCASARRVCERVSVCVCCTHLFSFFTLAFVLVNDLSLVSCFGNAYDFVFVFVAVCFFLLYALVLCSEINHLT